MLRIYKIAHNSKIYGPGNRDVIWFKGCSLHCKNCINPELWSFDGGQLLSVEDIIGKLDAKHVTLLGGEPLEQDEILPFIKSLKKKRVGIIMFTGYEQNELLGDKQKAANLCDVVIYGRYIDKLKDDSLYLRGSLNQTIVFNSNKYKADQFKRPNSYEINISKGIEVHGRKKLLINELFDLDDNSEIEKYD